MGANTSKDNYGLPAHINMKGIGKDKAERFAKVYNLISKEGAKYPEVVAFQWALETNWGSAHSGKNNVFGVKALPGQAGTNRTTKEDYGNGKVTIVDKFKDYDSEEDSVRDRLNRSKWKKAEQRSDNAEDYINYMTFVNNYATDKEYDLKLKSMLKTRAGYDINVPKSEQGVANINAAYEGRKSEFLSKLGMPNKSAGFSNTTAKEFGNAGLSVQNTPYAGLTNPQGNLQMNQGNQPFVIEDDTYREIPKQAPAFKPSLDYLSTLNPVNNVGVKSMKIPSVEEAAQKAGLNKEREGKFNFSGVPIISKKQGLVNMKNKYEYGGMITEFNTGGTHDENPNGGIPQGRDSNGTQNLVEEGETRYNDYIFSNKFFLSEEDIITARLSPKLIGKSIAEASKEINKYLEDAPFDKITRDTVQEQLDNLSVVNEKYKTLAEMDDLEGIANDPNPDGLVEPMGQGEGEPMGGELPIDDMGQEEFTDPNDNLLPDMPIGGSEEFALGGNVSSLSNSISHKPVSTTFQPSVGAVDVANSNGKFNAFTPSNKGGSSIMSTIGFGANGLGAAMGGGNNSMYGEAQDNQMLGGVKDTVSSALGPFGQLFRGIQKAGEGIGNTIGGGIGAGVASAFSPEEATMANLKDPDMNFGEKLLGTVPILNGVMAHNSRQRKLRKAKEAAVTGDYNSKFFGEEMTYQMANGGKVKTKSDLIANALLKSSNSTLDSLKEQVPGLNKQEYKPSGKRLEDIKIPSVTKIYNKIEPKGVPLEDLKIPHVTKIYNEIAKQGIPLEDIKVPYVTRIYNALQEKGIPLEDIKIPYVTRIYNEIEKKGIALEDIQVPYVTRIYNEIENKGVNTSLEDIKVPYVTKIYNKQDQLDPKYQVPVTNNNGTVSSGGKKQTFTPSAKRVTEQAIKGNIPTVQEKQIEDNFKLANIGGVGTPEEQQALANVYPYGPTTENPIFNTPNPSVESGYTSDNTSGTGQQSTAGNEVKGGFKPTNSMLGNILGAAPIAGSIRNILDPVKAEQVSYQTNDFVYTPQRIDENSILNSIRQGSANTLKSLEQSGMSAGQMMAAKLATGANEMRAMSDAQLKINEYNNSENTKAQDVAMQMGVSNNAIINKQIEDNLASRSMADTQNRVYRDSLYNNIGQYGLERQRQDTIYNLNRGYNADGTYGKKKVLSFEEGGTLSSKFTPKSKEYEILDSILRNVDYGS